MKKNKINHIFAGALIAGAIKEWCDKQYGNGMDWKDFLFTVIGSLVPVLFILGLHFGKG